jgi:hypothetical protein
VSIIGTPMIPTFTSISSVITMAFSNGLKGWDEKLLAIGSGGVTKSGGVNPSTKM